MIYFSKIDTLSCEFWFDLEDNLKMFCVNFQKVLCQLYIKKNTKSSYMMMGKIESFRVGKEERERCHILTTLAGWLISHGGAGNREC